MTFQWLMVLQLGDDPFPDPTCGVTKPIADAGVFNGWQYEGCFTDLYGQRTLSDWQWSNANTTIQTCTSECASLGYTIAGLEYGNGRSRQKPLLGHD